MRVTVRTIARLGAHLPGDASRPGQGAEIELEVPPGTTPSEIIARLGLSDDRLYLVKVNGRVLPLARHALVRLRDRDRLTILPKPKYG